MPAQGPRAFDWRAAGPRRAFEALRPMFTQGKARPIAQLKKNFPWKDHKDSCGGVTLVVFLEYHPMFQITGTKVRLLGEEELCAAPAAAPAEGAPEQQPPAAAPPAKRLRGMEWLQAAAVTAQKRRQDRDQRQCAGELAARLTEAPWSETVTPFAVPSFSFAVAWTKLRL